MSPGRPVVGGASSVDGRSSVGGSPRVTGTSDGALHDSWTRALRERLSRTVPPGQLLPDRQPAGARSWIYVFGV